QLGRAADVLQPLRDLAAEHPHREAPRRLLMLALYRCGRQPEALAVYRETRARLADELGLEPSEELRRLEAQILAQAPELDLEPPPPAATAPPRAKTIGERRLVSVVCVELGDLGEPLDVEALHALVLACWQRCAAVFESHGGAVERHGDDAIVGSFGVAGVHEDDALRALGAAAELRDASDVALRVGVDTGQVFIGGAADGAPLAIGEPVRNAARLARIAADGEVLFGRETWALARHAVRAEPIGTAYRLSGFAEAPVTGEPPFVGRAAEQRALAEALAPPDRCRLVTVIGAAGVGKSRLAREVVARSGARVLVGRCRAYGEGVTYGPLAEIVRQLPEQPLDPAVRSAIGTADAPRRAEETALAFRRLFERLAAERPLVLVLEDIHWAAPTLLDLLEYTATFSTGFPIVLLCLGRPELLESRPGWPTAIALEPLGVQDSRALAERLGAGAGADRIVALAEGNPLFLQHLVAMGPSETLPTSVRALLAARIEQLEPDERELLMSASVEGRTFHVDALPGGDLATPLVALARKQLIRAEPVALAGEDAFRFAHALIRETAYAGLSKQRRAELHEHVARWLADRPDALDELIGHHLERACGYRSELGQTPELAGEAARRLAAGAQAALTRGDIPAGADLLERAVALSPEPALLAALGSALFEAGRLEDAERVLADAGDEVGLEVLRLHLGGTVARAREAADRALKTCADDRGLCRAWRLQAWIAWTESRAADADEAWGHALEHARDPRERFQILGWRASAAAFGPLPVPEAIARCRAIRDEVRESAVAHAVAARPLALLHALAGDATTARRLIEESSAALAELGRMHSAVSHHEAIVHMLAGDPAAAEHHLRRGMARLEQMGERALLATTAACLGQAVLAQGRDAEAEALCEMSAADADADDLITHVLWRGTLARVLAGRGHLVQGEALAREAVAFAERTDALVDHGEALLGLAEILALSGRPDAAHAAARRALELFERKEATVPADRARAFDAHMEVRCPVPSSSLPS
ncbi:MAG TPA: BTAD domain-containing putative transcriptional regulator, partial [Solirubrobacteraceae bacterium]|nr:BTAD domain-containing putative transcriptional regulator [Solirubrobacteraceae bacterium]